MRVEEIYSLRSKFGLGICVALIMGLSGHVYAQEGGEKSDPFGGVALPLPAVIAGEKSSDKEVKPMITAPDMSDPVEDPSTENPLAWDGAAPEKKEDQSASPLQPVQESSVPVPEQKVEQAVEAPIDAPVADTSMLDARMSALEEQMKMLKTKVDDLSAHVSSSSVQLKETKSLDAKSTDPAPVKKEKRAVIKKASEPEKPAPKWVLRSAKEGMAWISEEGSTEMRTVSVGMTVPGLGKISTIEQGTNGSWVVKGSSGQVGQ